MKKSKIIGGLVLLAMLFSSLFVLTACSFNKKLYIFFETNGGSTIEKKEVSTSGVVKLPTAPVKEGMLFDGWMMEKNYTAPLIEIKDGVCYYGSAENPSKFKPTTNVILYAKWIDILVYDVDKTTNTVEISLQQKYADRVIELLIPSFQYNDMPIISIKANGFSDMPMLRKVHIPSNIEKIGESAFAGNVDLTRVEFDKESKVKSLAKSAFEKCSNLSDVILPDGLETIETKAFSGCWALYNVQLGKSLKVIANSAFEDCSILKEITFPATLTTIEEKAFNSCLSLTNVMLLSSIAEIKSGAFANCSSLIIFCEVNETPVGWARDWVPSSNTPIIYWGIGADKIVKKDGVHYINQHGAMLVARGDSGIKNVTIESEINSIKVTKIGEKAFYYNNDIRSIIIPSTVEVILDSAFSSCSSLSSVGLNAGLKEIGANAFEDNDALTEIKLPNTVELIGNSAFYSCDAMLFVEFSESLKRINKSAFEDCTELENVVLPIGLVNIGSYAFKRTKIVEIVIPISVGAINEGAFEQCTKLQTVTFNAITPILGNSLFKGSLELRTVTLPTNMQKVPDNMFENCINLTEIILPNRVNTIGANAFKGSRNLSVVTFTDTLKNIENNAFENCKSLKGINLRKVEKLGSEVFKGCSALTEIFIPATVSEMGISLFTDCNALEEIRCGVNSAQSGWSASWNSNKKIVFGANK